MYYSGNDRIPLAFILTFLQSCLPKGSGCESWELRNVPKILFVIQEGIYSTTTVLNLSLITNILLYNLYTMCVSSERNWFGCLIIHFTFCIHFKNLLPESSFLGFLLSYKIILFLLFWAEISSLNIIKLPSTVFDFDLSESNLTPCHFYFWRIRSLPASLVPEQTLTTTLL